jgi:predicted transcriptional regulator
MPFQIGSNGEARSLKGAAFSEVGPDDSLHELCKRFARHRIRSIPVIDRSKDPMLLMVATYTLVVRFLVFHVDE